MDLTNYGRSLVDKWEKSTGQKHKGQVEIQPGAILPYYDHRFVADLLGLAEILYNRSNKLKKELIDIRDELRS